MVRTRIKIVKKQPGSLYYEGAGGCFEIRVDRLSSEIHLHGDDSTIRVAQDDAGRAFAKELLLFAQRVAQYTGLDPE